MVYREILGGKDGDKSSLLGNNYDGPYISLFVQLYI